MNLDYISSVSELIVCVITLSICLFHYATYKNRNLTYIIVFFLSMVSSGYYWTVYLFIVRNTPNVADVFYYLGANCAYLFMLFFMLRIKTPETKRFFHWAMLLPIPINIPQLILYMSFDGKINSIYQVITASVISVLTIQEICWNLKNNKKNIDSMHVSLAILLFITFSFGRWTSSCFDGPVYNLYYVFSFLILIVYGYLTWAICRIFKHNNAIVLNNNFHINFIKCLYVIVLSALLCEGFFFSKWVKRVIDSSLNSVNINSMYNIIMAVLFITSMLIIAFVVSIIFAINFTEKDIENTMLREEKIVANKANEAKSDFLASMSHEIRTPINAIMGMNEMILSKSAKENNKEIFEYAQTVKNASNNLLALINDILDFSKIESGKFEIVGDNYNLSSVLGDVNDIISIRADAKKLKFDIILDKAIPDELFGDSKRIYQIIINLLNNAIKYTEKGSVTLHVSCTSNNIVKYAITNLIFSVEDTGIGIKKEDIDKLFNKFERLELERNKTIEGTGLGLAITHKLLEMMGGKVEVSSVYGKGSTFKVTIPQEIMGTEIVGDFKKKPIDELINKNVNEKNIYAPDANILLVDDNKINRMVAVALLKKTGVKIDEAESGQESIDKAKDKKYDLILMDQLMPGMNGNDALKIIRNQENGENADTPIICLTADAIGDAKDKYIEEGFSDYLSKPVDSNLLEKALKTFLPKDKCRQIV